MNRYTEENDITTREFILLGAMLIIMVLSVIGLLNVLSEAANSSIWEMLSLDRIWTAFAQLVGKLLC